MTWLPETNELAPGVTIERCAILWAPLALAAALHAAPDTKLGVFAGLEPKVEFGPSFRGVPFAIPARRLRS